MEFRIMGATVKTGTLTPLGEKLLKSLNSLQDGELLTFEALCQKANMRAVSARSYAGNRVFSDYKVSYSGRKLWGNKKTIKEWNKKYDTL